jgi:cytochrome c peroxidase
MRPEGVFCRSPRAIGGALIVVLASASVTHEGPTAQTMRTLAATEMKTEVLREWIGERIFFDARLSEPAGVSCASCHDPARAFTGDNGRNSSSRAASRAAARQ